MESAGGVREERQALHGDRGPCRRRRWFGDFAEKDPWPSRKEGRRLMMITKETQVGTEFIGKSKRLAESRVLAFSGGRLNASGWPSKQWSLQKRLRIPRFPSLSLSGVTINTGIKLPLELPRI